MNVAIKPFLKSGKIWAVTLEIKNAYTKMYNKAIPSNNVSTIPMEIIDFNQNTEKNNILKIFLSLDYYPITIIIRKKY